MVLAAALALSACATGPSLPPAAELPLSPATLTLLARKGMTPAAPVFVRIFKEESELEVWKQREDGRFYLFKTYPICHWSGDLGPKLKQGDKQAPEGFYTVAKGQLNPNSQFYLAFNLGFPNAYDRALDRTGDFLMVHGQCRSAGCYAMTDALMEEIYGLVREALRGGQAAFHVHAFPFRPTPANMARHAKSPWIKFWTTLKEGYDAFETTRIPPDVAVCEKRYVVDVTLPQSKPDPEGPCPRFKRPVHTAFVPLPEPAAVAAAAAAKAAATATTPAATPAATTPAATTPPVTTSAATTSAATAASATATPATPATAAPKAASPAPLAVPAPVPAVRPSAAQPPSVPAAAPVPAPTVPAVKGPAANRTVPAPATRSALGVGGG
jgi:murein L,D-transpeptidase YafK